jgi:hypothetical protein
MPRFVVLEHDSPRGLHWDLMLETAGVLATWALPRPPEPGLTIEAEALPGHRLAYLDYEGRISGGRGSVARWDQGTYAIQRWAASAIAVVLHGGRIKGLVTLDQISAQPARWRFSAVPSLLPPGEGCSDAPP